MGNHRRPKQVECGKDAVDNVVEHLLNIVEHLLNIVEHLLNIVEHLVLVFLLVLVQVEMVNHGLICLLLKLNHGFLNDLKQQYLVSL